MSLDDHAISELRARGALVGTSNADEWERLVLKHGLGTVCWAIGKARATLKRQPTWQQVEDEMPKVTVKAKGETVATIPPATFVVSHNPVGTASAAPFTIIRSTSPAPADASGEAAPEQAASQDAVRTMKDEDMPKPKAKRSSPQTIDYAALLKQFPGITVTELAARAGVPRSKADGWIHRNTEQLVEHGKYGKRYWLKEDKRAPKSGEESTAKPTSSKRARRAPREAAKDAEPRATVSDPLGVLTDATFVQLLGNLIDVYIERHDIAIKPSARRTLMQAAEALFP